jgi:prepilin-type N-terminal cleavage/methylation domain-containing protein
MASPERGHSLIEMLAALVVLGALFTLGVPWVRAYYAEATLLGAGRVFQGEFRKARSIAVRSSAFTAIRFEAAPDGTWFYSTYADGNRNGVLAADIRRGVDRRIAGPRRLDAGAAGVHVGINPGVPAVPPDTGMLDPSRPIQFGSASMLSFSPLGTATPGTFYLAGVAKQAAVRVSPGSARVRLLIWSRGRRWTEH